ncbi:MAG: WD40/YVTN/BNR-like repeat-containing protein [Terriglobales bacterium]
MHSGLLALRRLVVIPLVLAATAVLAVGQVSPSLYAGLRWRMIGPFRGGRVLAVSGVPGQPNRFYFGAVGGGVWETNDAGRVWRPIFDHQPIASIGALAVAPSDPNVIYVGTGEADMRSDISFGDGVYKSTDAGRTWTHVGLAATRHIGAIVVDPRDPNLVLVAALGRAYGPSPDRGIYRSADGGRTWSKVLYKDENTGGIDLAFDPTNDHIVFAALWNTRRPPWNQYPPTQGPGSGIYRSSDEGLTWTQISGHGLPDAPWGRVGIAVAAGGNRVFALIAAKEGGLFRSDDGGQAWKRVSADPRIDSRSWYFSGVYPDPRDPNVLYIADVALYRSINGGETFSVVKGSPGGDDYHALWIDPNDSRRVILGSDQGAAISINGGHTWTSWYNQPTAQFYHVITDNRFPYWVYGSQQDSGTAAVVSRGDYGQISFRDWHPIGGGESGYVAPDPLHPDIVYGGSTGGIVMRWNQVTGQSQNVSPWSGADKYRFTWTFPIVFSPQDPRTLYVGAQYVLATHDGGQSWQAVSPDLTQYQTGEAAPGGLAAEDYKNGENRGVVYTIAPSPAKAGLIWAGTDDGLVWITQDGGQHWSNVTPSGLPAWSKISLIDASRLDPATAYAAVDRHRLDDFKPYIYRTHDFGRTWQAVVAGIPDDDYVHAVRADPERKGLLYAGTEKGVFVSFDDGSHWQPLQLNLPVTSIRDLVVHDNDLIVATHGRSFWILDDVTPLRQIAAAVNPGQPYLFPPETAIRIRANEGQDTPLPPEEPRGHNPPDGAIIDYYFPAAPDGVVTLEIDDAQGRLVRRFSSEVAEPAPPPAPTAIAPYWFPPPRPLPKRAGLNRFVWNLRYPTPSALAPDFGIWATPHHAEQTPEGALVLPGRYQLKLTAAGQTFTQPLEVKLDPRVQVPQEALAAQLTLEQQIAAGIETSAGAIRAIGDLHRQLAALEARLADNHAARDIVAAAKALDAKAQVLAGSSASPFGTGALGAGFERVNGDLSDLMNVVESADAAPTAQAQAAYQGTRTDLAALAEQWKLLQSTDLARLNRRIRDSAIPAIGLPASAPSGGAPPQ